MRLASLLNLSIGTFLWPCVGGEQTWLSQPAYAEVNPGGSVVLPCKVQDLMGECRWSKEGTPVGIFKGKYELITYFI